jgi:Na+/H+ antiporter NhaA
VSTWPRWAPAWPLVIGARRLGVRHGPGYLLLGVAAWIAFFKSGVDPVVVGLVMGLLALAYPATRRDLERAFESFRLSVTTRAQNRSQCTSESASTITS